MNARSRAITARVLLLIWTLAFSGYGRAHSLCLQEPVDERTPENTVILANQIDARFVQDYSVLLKSLRVEWAVVDGASVPEPAKGKNLILLGRLDGPYTGEIMERVLTDEEIETIRSAGSRHVVLVKASPWAAGKSVTICTGADLLLVRNAAEEVVREMVARAPTASTWIQTRYDAPLDQDVREYVNRLRYTWDDAELPLAEMRVDLRAKPRRRISAKQAAEDVERLFYLFSHGYSGYAFYDQQAEWDQARASILAELSSRTTWPSHDLSRLLYEHLGFIADSHLKIGDYQYARHADFWYDTDLELAPGIAGYRVAVEGEPYDVVSVNRQGTETFVFPSLNARGEPVYRLGTLSETEPAPLQLLVARGGEEREFEIALQRSDFDYYAEDVFREDKLGGIPVLRIRGFGDVDQDELQRFVETASAYKDEPVLIVDARGNGGGNEKWPSQWIQALTGRRPGSVLIWTELHSKTTMAGRANLFAYYDQLYPGMDTFRREAEGWTLAAQAYEDGAQQPGWTSPRYPQTTVIPNDTTVILVMNGLVASAGEGLLMRASQAENVVLVGENSMGALTFGNISFHQLPHSRLRVTLPINVNLFLDRQSREGRGITPDLWVPAADAVNYAVAAIRAGTISTHQPLSQAILEKPFVAEDPWARVRREAIIRGLMTAALAVVGVAWAYFQRSKPGLTAGLGAVWLIIGGILVATERPVGLGFLLAGGVCLMWGVVSLHRAHKTPVERAA